MKIFNSIIFRILSSYIALTIITFVMGVLAVVSFKQINNANTLATGFLKLEKNIEKLNSKAIEFMLVDRNNQAFMRTGKSQITDQYELSLHEINLLLNDLSLYYDQSNSRLIDSLGKQVKQLEQNFMDLRELVKQRGTETYGVVGEFENAAAKLVKFDFGDAKGGISQFRVHEKDYLLTGNRASFERLNEEFYNFSLLAEQYIDSSDQQTVIDLLSNYELAMNKLVALDTAIGSNFNTGLQGKVRRNLTEIDYLTSGAGLRIAEATQSVINRVLTITLVSMVMALIIAIFVSVLIPVSIVKPLRELKNYIGNLGEGKLLTKVSTEFKGEIGEMAHSISVLNSNLWNVKHFAEEVGKGNFDTNINVFDDKGELGEALAGMRESLKRVAAEEKDRNWMISGQAHFADLLRSAGEDLYTIGSALLSGLCKYIDAQVASLYILDEESKPALLKAVATYGYGRNRTHEKNIEPGDGLLGQTFLEGENTYITHLPDEYMLIRSGLGDSVPRALMLLPLVNGGINFGILEIASLKPFDERTKMLIEKVVESATAVIASIKSGERTRRLLAATEIQTLQIREQEEAMRQNFEELMASQEEMRRREQELLNEIEQLKSQLSKQQTFSH